MRSMDSKRLLLVIKLWVWGSRGPARKVNFKISNGKVGPGDASFQTLFPK